MQTRQAILVNERWQDVPGTTHTRIFPCIRKPDVTSSNVYLLTIGDYIVFFDTGASQEVMDTVCDALSTCTCDREKPLIIIFGHAHYDHIYEGLVDRRFESFGKPVFVCHASGAGLLQSGDQRYTQADLVDLPIPPLQIDLPLFRVKNQESERLRALPGFQHRIKEIHITDELLLLSEEICFPDGQSLTFWAVPGHSDDSVAIRIGHLLHVGDIPFALNPGVAGIVGWDTVEFSKTLQRLEWILKNQEISVVCPGHGYALSAPEFQKVLRTLKKSHENLPDVALFDKGRVNLSMRHAMDLMDEAYKLFPIVAGRIMLLRYHLEELEEYETAQELEQAVPVDEIEFILDGFTAYYREFQERKVSELQLIIKALQTLQKIRSFLPGHTIEHLVDPSLVRRTTKLFSDLLSTMQGVIPTATLTSCDPVQILNDLIVKQNSCAITDDELLLSTDDAISFRKVLLSRLAEYQSRNDLRFSIRAPDSVQLIYADADRLSDIFSALTDYYRMYGADIVSVQILLKEDSVHIAITPIGKNWKPELPLSRALLRTVRYAGGKIVKLPKPGDEEIILQFPKQNDESGGPDQDKSNII